MRKPAIISIYIILPMVAAIISFKVAEHFFFAPLDQTNPTTSIFTVVPSKPFRDVASDLEINNFIRSRLAIRLLAKYQKKDTLVMAGEYEFSPAMSPQEILDAMVEGKMILRTVTIKEGATLKDIGKALEDAGVTTRPLFEAALNNAPLRESLKIPASSFEGYLFPETYRIQRDTPPEKIIKTLKEQLDSRWPDSWNLRLVQLEMTKHQILTLASIIEKESGNAEEQPIVSSVFHNRLKKGMKLQSDPTVIYGIPNFNGNITRSDLTTPTEYNTYVIRGLPPGPIASPGVSAIKAALFPAETNYFYFVGNGKGEHIFSVTLDQHNQAVNIFQRGIGSQESPAPEPIPSDTPAGQPET